MIERQVKTLIFNKMSASQKKVVFCEKLHLGVALIFEIIVKILFLVTLPDKYISGGGVKILNRSIQPLRKDLAHPL